MSHMIIGNKSVITAIATNEFNTTRKTAERALGKFIKLALKLWHNIFLKCNFYFLV